jgi:ribosomal protection tetracycline resistance protein
MRTLNLGILAHVDAGKTSPTERLLYAAGVIDEVGSVDGGSTQTDALALEQEHGITIKSDVVSFVVDDVAINLLDTPGHPDFIAKVGRVLGVHDSAVLECDFDGTSYQPVKGKPPTRPQTCHNPLDREEYLRRVARRV